WAAEGQALWRGDGPGGTLGAGTTSGKVGGFDTTQPGKGTTERSQGSHHPTGPAAIAQGVMSSQLGAHYSRRSGAADLPAIGFAKSKKEEDRTRRRDETLGGAHVASHAKDRTTTATSWIGMQGLKSESC